MAIGMYDLMCLAEYEQGGNMKRTWMIRGDGGRLYDVFRDQAVVAIGWAEIAAEVQPGMTKKEITALYRRINPRLKVGSAISGAAQVWRFLNEITVGDQVVTYAPGNRTYLIGTVLGAAVYKPHSAQEGLALVRPVQWLDVEVDRDSLPQRTKNSLGSTLTVFVVPEIAASQVRDAAEGKTTAHSSLVGTGEEVEEEEDEESPEVLPPTDLLDGIQALAIERIKDLVVDLNWDEMQELVAGILRAMGYKTQVSPPGPDRGKDIIASPDGFGFEHPRIIVEVKHRSGQMGSQAIRSFLGGRHKDDRGLYVSTGGFSKDAC